MESKQNEIQNLRIEHFESVISDTHLQIDTNMRIAKSLESSELVDLETWKLDCFKYKIKCLYDVRSYVCLGEKGVFSDYRDLCIRLICDDLQGYEIQVIRDVLGLIRKVHRIIGKNNNGLIYSKISDKKVHLILHLNS